MYLHFIENSVDDFYTDLSYTHETARVEQLYKVNF